jgi:hypothetical protein
MRLPTKVCLCVEFGSKFNLPTVLCCCFNFLLIIFVVKCSFEVPLQVFSYQWLAHAIILKTNNLPHDLYNSK